FGRKIVDHFAVGGVDDGHATEADVVCEEVKETAPCGDDPGTFALIEGPFEHQTSPGETDRCLAAKPAAIAFPLGDLEDARNPIEIGGGVAAGEEIHVLQEVDVEDA